MIISTSRLSARAREYFGDDVQAYGIERVGPTSYRIWQRPHRGDLRTAAAVAAANARDAIRDFNAMAAVADRRCR